MPVADPEVEFAEIVAERPIPVAEPVAEPLPDKTKADPADAVVKADPEACQTKGST